MLADITDEETLHFARMVAFATNHLQNPISGAGSYMFSLLGSLHIRNGPTRVRRKQSTKLRNMGNQTTLRALKQRVGSQMEECESFRKKKRICILTTWLIENTSYVSSLK